MEKIVESKICKHCNISFDITDKDLEFYEKVLPIFNGVKYSIPTPTLCPDCRQQVRLSFRNERNLYKRKCDFTGKEIISIYSPDKPYKIYNQQDWWSDKWDAMDYSKEFDFNRPFFEQFNDLLIKVPIVSLSTNFTQDENSPYTNYAGSNKNCYMVFDSDFNKDCFYLSSSTKNENCIDCHATHSSQLCYQTIGSENCNLCFFTINSSDCSECIECYNCTGCKNCYGCSNLNNKEYHIFNVGYSREDYEVEILKILTDKKINFNEFLKHPKKGIISLNSENVSGNYIFNSKNIQNSYEIYDSKDCKYCFGLHDINSSYDVSGFGIAGLDKIYNCHVVGVGGFNILFSNIVVGNCNNIFYSNNIYNNSSNLFGCVGLVGKSYCILNKQYTKDEYEVLVPKIIEHMIKTKEYGEFFPSSISPFGYNETVAQEYYPLSKEQILRTGPETSDSIRTGPGFLHGPIFNYSTYEPPTPQVSKTIPSSKLPDNIKDIPDDILNWAIIPDDEDNQDDDNIRNDAIVPYNKPFRIIKQELEFYKKHNIPIPRKHPDQRHLDRMKLRNPRKLYNRNCDKCNKEIKTTYNPTRSEIIYCEDCYNKEIY